VLARAAAARAATTVGRVRMEDLSERVVRGTGVT
jgi:hypothetical protein